jgi:ribosome-binding protein aMBF1 (putative translation factor)
VARKLKFESPALQHTYDRFIAGDPTSVEAYEQELLNAELAQMIYDLRVAAGLTQRQLAERIGTTPSVISRLEDADYAGHSMAMLRRVADALHQRVEVRFVPKTDPPHSDVRR